MVINQNYFRNGDQNPKKAESCSQFFGFRRLQQDTFFIFVALRFRTPPATTLYNHPSDFRLLSPVFYLLFLPLHLHRFLSGSK